MSGIEIIGTIAAISEIVKRANQCYDIIKRLRKAPRDFSLLLKEVSFAKVALGLAEKQLKGLDTRATGESTINEWVEAINELGHRADSKLKEIDDLVKRVTEPKGDVLIVKRVQWVLEANALTELRLGLASIREEFNIALGIAQGEHQKYAVDRLEHLGNLAEKIYNDIGRQSLVVAANEELIRSLCQAFEDSIKFNSNKPRRGSKMVDFDPPSPDLELGTQLSLTESNESDDTTSHRGSITEELSALGRRRRSPDSSGSLSLSPIRHRDPYVRPFRACDPACRCKCHHNRRLSTPRLLSTLVGHGSVTVSGWSTMRPACSLPNSCKRSPDWTGHATYVFPTWFLLKAISAHMHSGPLGEPALQLQTRNIALTDAFRLAQVGDWRGMHDLYRNGKGSVHDVHPQEGQSALLVAIWCGQAEVVRYLLSKNAKKEEETFDGLATTDAALRHVFGRVSTPSTVALLAHLFNIEELREEQQFNVIHKIVLGLADSRDLEEECKEHPELVDEPDLRGRTPLWWAALRHEYDDCRILLEHNASPNTSDYQGETIMQNAAATPRPELIELLIDHGGDIGKGSGVSETPLHYAARSNSRVETVYSLLDRGADPNASNVNGVTPFHECIEVDGIDVAMLLCKFGAELNRRDATRDTYVHMAIRCRASRILDLLISQGADLRLLGHEGQSVLHKAAKYGDERTIKVLLEAPLSSIDISLKDVAGRTAQSYLEERMSDAKRTKAADELFLETLLKQLLKYAESTSEPLKDDLARQQDRPGVFDALPDLIEC